MEEVFYLARYNIFSSDYIYLQANSTSTMPRAVQPGRLSGKMHVHYTTRHKLALLASAKRSGD